MDLRGLLMGEVADSFMMERIRSIFAWRTSCVVSPSSHSLRLMICEMEQLYWLQRSKSSAPFLKSIVFLLELSYFAEVLAACLATLPAALVGLGLILMMPVL